MKILRDRKRERGRDGAWEIEKKWRLDREKEKERDYNIEKI